MSACSAACGWCGMCTAAWEGPDQYRRQTIGLICDQCGAIYELSTETSVPHNGRCAGCLALDAFYTDLKGTKGAA